MINFDEELKNFKPILEIDKIENSIKNDEMTDIIDLLMELAKDR